MLAIRCDNDVSLAFESPHDDRIWWLRLANIQPTGAHGFDRRNDLLMLFVPE